MFKHGQTSRRDKAHLYVNLKGVLLQQRMTNELLQKTIEQFMV